MGRAIGPTGPLAYTDNERVTVATRLLDELRRDPRQLDVATGYLTPSVWTALGGVLPTVQHFRLLLGKDYELTRAGRETAEDTIQALVQTALTTELGRVPLPTRDEAAAVRGWLAFLARPNDAVDVRVWSDGFLHAKAYLLAATAGVGSANFTAAGLATNKELVAWREDRSVVAELQDWFDDHWARATPYKAELQALLAASRFGTTAYTPYDVLIRVLADRYGTDRPPALERAHFTLQWFQEDAVFRLIRLLDGPARGALLADAVGLGKTYMALGVIHHVLYAARGPRPGRGRPVLLVVPASVERMWQAALESAGLDWACRVVTLQSLRAETDVTPWQHADLVVVDEAHRLRGGGVWFRRLLDIVTRRGEPPQVLLLTATPVHTGLKDLTHLLRVLTKNRRDVWAPAVADFDAYLRRVERHEVDPFPVLDRAVVRRSRSDLLRAQAERAAAGFQDAPLVLPVRQPTHVRYADATTGDAGLFARFATTVRALTLVPYQLDRFRTAAAGEAIASRPSELAGLVLAGLLKRYESSLRAVRTSLARLDAVLAATETGLAADPPQVLNLQDPEVKRALAQEAAGDDDEDPEPDWEPVWQRQAPLADPATFDRAAARAALAADRAHLAALRTALPAEATDGKIAALRALLTDPRRLGTERVLVFSQYRDTAAYIAACLDQDPAVGPVGLIHGGTPAATRAALTAPFDPHTPGAPGEAAVRVLVSTDVLAEGHNLQRAAAVVNFDLPWNPQVVVQRAGRIDRLDSPHPTVHLVSFLPSEGLEAHLGLVQALDRRFGLIHHLGLGDEPVTQLAGDYQATTFEQLRRLYQDDPTVFDDIERAMTLASSDYMRAPLEHFLQAAGAAQVAAIPVGVQSLKRAPTGWPPGTFIAWRHGAPGSGETLWRYYPDDGGAVLTDESALFRAIVCMPEEPRADAGDLPLEPGGLIDWDLLRRAAAEAADALNRRYATAQVARGASEASRRLRQDFLSLATVTGYTGADLDAVLDRLEEVRVEDVDHRPAYRALREALRAARRDPANPEAPAAVGRAVALAGELWGAPEGVPAADAQPVAAADLVLVAWERIVAG